MTIQVVYIDDIESELNKYQKKLQIRGRIKVIKRFPSRQMEDLPTIQKLRPDLLLVDLYLTKRIRDKEPVPYEGDTLATGLRKVLPEYPIVLFTRKSLIQRFQDIPNIRDYVDKIVYKDDVDSDPKKSITDLICLAEGFRDLRATKKTWEGLMEIMRATKNEEDSLKKAVPPLINGKWLVAEVADWILNVVLKYPGILYDSVHAATALGLSEKTFLQKEVQNIFKAALHNGVFQCSNNKYWWRERLFEAAFKLMNEEEKKHPLLIAFPKAYERKIGKKPQLARCIFSGEEPADWVCYIRKQPVSLRYTLPYFPDNRPPIMDEARVSFKAIREDNFDETKFDMEGRRMLQKIRNNRSIQK